MRLSRPLGLVFLLAVLGAALPAHGQVEMPPHTIGEVMAQADSADTPILVEVYAPWCPYCQRMQKTVYGDASVQSYLAEHFTYARLNSDTTAGTHRYANRTLNASELASVLGARGVPTTVFMTADGTLIARQPGYIGRATFLRMLRYIGSGAYKDQSFKAFMGRQSE